MVDPVKRIYEIIADGNFSSSSSAKTVGLHFEMQEIFGTLAPCQLPEFLSHEHKWVRYYAKERMPA